MTTTERSRRLDWRFLLWSPELGRVLFAGPGNAALLAAMREQAPSITLMEKKGARGTDDLFDGAVVSDADASSLSTACDALRPDGWLYVECHPGGWLAGSRRARRWATLLKSLGMRDIEMFWHWPDFERCAEIIPLDHERATELFVRRRLSGAGRAWKKRILEGLWRCGWIGGLARSVSIVARKAPSP